jgi:hypothetical protein
VGLVESSLIDPALKDRDLARGETAELGLGRWHHLLLVGARDSEEDFAFGALSGHDRRESLPGPGCALAGIEAQTSLSILLVRTVAVVALVRENRPDLPIEIDWARGRRGTREKQRSDEERQC